MGGGGSKKKLAKEDMDFLIDNTNFSKQQIKQWYKGFMVSAQRLPNSSVYSSNMVWIMESLKW